MSHRFFHVACFRRIAIAIALAAFWFGCVPSVSRAAALASYPFSSGSAASTDAELNTIASNFTNGLFTGGTITGNVAISSSTNNAYIRSQASTDTTAADSVLHDDSWGFTVTPNAGTTMNLTSIDFKVGSNSSGANTFTANFVVRCSLDSYATDLGAGTYSKATTGTTGSFTALQSIDLSALAAFQNLTDPITFKFFEFDDLATSGDIARLDDVALNGTVVVPEPASLSLLALGALLLGRPRRRA